MQWRIELFGGLRATCGEETLAQFRSRKTAALLAYLAFFRGPHPRDQLVEMLWPGFALEAGRNSLRVALADLRRRSTVTDENGVVISPPLLQQDRGSVGLAREVTTDVAEFERAVDEARRALSLEVRVAAYERARTLYRGTLLAGLYESWIPIEEARLEATYLHVLKTLQGFYENAGDSARAFEMAQLAARLEPREEAQSRMTRGDTSRPQSPKGVNGHDGDKGSPSVATPSQKFVAPVPASFTRFFGRGAELRELATRLLEGKTRILTITGVGGLGKTRLALELARQMERAPAEAAKEKRGARFDRVLWVSLADSSEAGRLPQDLLKALDLTVNAAEAGNADPVDILARFLRGEGKTVQRTLLALDNFEQLLPRGSVFLGELLERVSGLTLLVTSRQRLNLRGEWEHRIGALALPAQHLPSFVAPADEKVWNEQQLAMLRESSSVQLFADRARSARADWRLLPREASTLVSLLYRLEGIPLAIELVASRAGVLSLEQMLERLGQSLQWVASRDLHRPARHRSLHAVLDWSLQLLPTREREIFARLSVFHGGWTLEDASAVLADIEPDTLLEALQSLRDASLIASDESEGGSLRFSMLELVRQIAWERLDEETRQAMRRSHAEFFFHMAERASNNEEDYMRRGVWGATEAHNFSVALDYWTEADIERALQMASLLWWHWIYSTHLPAGRHSLQTLLAHPEATEFPIARARAQGCAAYVALLSGYHDEMDQLLGEALKVWTGEEHQKELAQTLNLLGALAVARGQKERARDFYSQSLAIHRVISQRHELTIAINALAAIERDCGHEEEARLLCAEALELTRQTGDQGAESWVYHTLGLLELDAGNLASAREYQEKSLAIRRSLKHLQGQASCLNALGEVALRAGQVELARTHYRQALEIWKQIKQTPKIQATEKMLAAIEEKEKKTARRRTPIAAK